METIRLYPLFRYHTPILADFGGILQLSENQKFEPVIFGGILQLSIEDRLGHDGKVRMAMVLTVIGTVGAGLVKETAIELAAKQAADWIESHFGGEKCRVNYSWRQVHDYMEFDPHGRTIKKDHLVTTIQEACKASTSSHPSPPPGHAKR